MVQFPGGAALSDPELEFRVKLSELEYSASPKAALYKRSRLPRLPSPPASPVARRRRSRPPAALISCFFRDAARLTAAPPKRGRD
jgi:hypothetical protein